MHQKCESMCTHPYMCVFEKLKVKGHTGSIRTTLKKKHTHTHTHPNWKILKYACRPVWFQW